MPSAQGDDGEVALDPRAGRRFAVVIHLLSLQHNRRLRIRCFAADNSLPVVPSLVDVWPVANWFEREAFDLFGIVGLTEMGIFISLLVLGFVYVWKKGALEWE